MGTIATNSPEISIHMRAPKPYMDPESRTRRLQKPFSHALPGNRTPDFFNNQFPGNRTVDPDQPKLFTARSYALLGLQHDYFTRKYTTLSRKLYGKYLPFLRYLMFQGSHGGFKWVTKGRSEYDESTQTFVKQYRFLLHHPHSFHLSKVITRGLKTKDRLVISLALSDIYKFASQNIDLCRSMEPQDFFAAAKNSYEWSSGITDKAFWALTYRAFHARALFLETVLTPYGEKPMEHPLVRALDLFREAFEDYYPIRAAEIADKLEKVCQENIERVQDELFLNKSLHAKYFPYELTHEDGEGDGEDKIIRIKHPKDENSHKEFNFNYLDKEELDLSKVPDHELFFYDTECKPRHHNAYKDQTVPKTTQKTTQNDIGPSGGAGTVRNYNAFVGYREKKDDFDADETGNGNGNGIDATRDAADDEDDAMADAGEDDRIPELKRLKIEEDN
ncbi:hypothetical protein AAE478_008252 [Parahypoxylon ruwenzoriense]